jgi:hypothetical protein
MLDKTITSALLNLRAKIIREGMGGRDHVEALSRARGMAPDAIRIKPKIPDNSFGRAQLKRLILEAQRSGPMTGRAPATYVAEHAPQITPEAAYKRVYIGLARMLRCGTVRREGRVWGLVVAESRNR